MADLFATNATGLSDPFDATFAITADQDIQPAGYSAPIVTRAIVISAAGDLSYVDRRGITRTHAVTVGLHPIRAARVVSSGTTCTIAYGGV